MSVDCELSLIQWCSSAVASNILPAACNVTITELEAIGLPRGPLGSHIRLHSNLISSQLGISQVADLLYLLHRVGLGTAGPYVSG